MTDDVTQSERALIATIEKNAAAQFPGSTAKVSRGDACWILRVDDGGLQHKIEAATLNGLQSLVEMVARERARVQGWRLL